ncbi:MAG: M24 family metallopeptidase [Gemmatimonadaceae bacterium]
MLTREMLPAVQQALRTAKLDGWLLFDFHGVNPVATGFLGLDGMVTRRIFAFVPARGNPLAITHNIEQGPWRHWPADWDRRRYSTWQTLEQTLREILRGKRVAMEYSPGDAVPYLDRVPAGVIEMVRAAGAEVVSSADLVTRFYATWTEDDLASHKRAATIIAAIGRESMELAGQRCSAGEPIREHDLREWITDRFAREGLITSHPPIVAAGANAANPHYEPSSDRPREIVAGDILLVDLWAREPAGVYADQTWMGSLGAPSPHAVEVWSAVRDGRDAAIAIVRSRGGSPTAEPSTGAEVDDAARNVISARGFGEYFTHRTGHSIDSRELHGSGPHIDNFETREERQLIPGVGFSIEPGIYIPGDLGMRSEVNVYMGSDGAIVTPADYQRDLLIV